MSGRDTSLAIEFAPVLSRATGIWEELCGARIFITGGTGFFGCWLLECLLAADKRFDLGVNVVLLTRDEAAFRARRPHLANAPQVRFFRGDVRDFAFPEEPFTHVVHAATEASARLEKNQPALMKDVIVAGTRRALEFAARCGARRTLFVSSGAVYGRQDPRTERLSEDDSSLSSPLDPAAAYADGKRDAESQCLLAADAGLHVSISRGFAFVGPYLPLDIHFAIGNFIRDALAGGPILVNGDGTPHRSYLYGADMAVWLWTILLKGAAGRAYNVGSERAVSIAELAHLVAAEIDPAAPVRIAKSPPLGRTVERYVPSTRRAREELGLRESVGLEEAVRRTAAWARRRPSPDSAAK